MKKFMIENSMTRTNFGIYEVETYMDALDAYARDAGYKDYNDLENESPSRPGEIVICRIDDE